MSFARKPYVRPPRQPVGRIENCRGVYTRSSNEAVAMPKGIQAKPGKRTPTALEAKWMSAIVEHGCVACLFDGVPPRPTAVHHIVIGNRRMGHLFTLGLCDPGHHQGGAEFGLISRHPFKARFEARYGKELDLLASLKVALGAFDFAEYVA